MARRRPEHHGSRNLHQSLGQTLAGALRPQLGGIERIDGGAILCDEPTGDLDRRTSDEVLTSLQLLNRELGKTILMVTHDAAAARADLVLHLDKGRFVEAEGTGA